MDRATVAPGLDAFEGGGGGDHQSIVEAAADDLQADGQAGERPARGDARGGLAGQIGGIERRRPGVVGDWRAVDRAGSVTIDRKGGERRGRRQDEVVIAHEAGHRV